MRPGSVSIDLVREACIIEALDHPGIPRVYECGVLADGRPWIATELIEGMSLATRQPTSMVEAAALVRDVADILAHAHARGVIHHNVVPEAILYPHARRWFPLCLVDWSLARSADMRMTDDIYALGTIARRILLATPANGRAPIFTALVERMLARDPHRRPTADNVRDHATWLTMQIAHENAQHLEYSVPAVIEDDGDEPLSVRNAIITSDLTPEVTGEITGD
jgi:serine/threonine protein kinase